MNDKDVIAASLFESLFESAPDAVVIIDSDGRIVLVNTQVEALFGYTRTQLIGEPVEILLPERYRSIHVSHRGSYLREPRIRSMGAGLDLYGLRSDGSEFPVDISLSPLQTDQGLRLAAAIRDVTERKAIEASQRESEDLLQAMMRSAADAIVLADSEGSIIGWNPAAESMFGYAAEEVIGQPLTILMPGRFQGDHTAGIARFRATGERRVIGRTVELEGRRKDGTEFPVELAIATWASGSEQRFSGVIRDVTERKRLEQARDEFIAHAAHELRTPLATLAGFGEMLADHMADMPKEQVDQALEALSRQGRRATMLVANLLDLTQLQSGRAKLDLGTVDIEGAVKGAVESAPPPDGRTVSMHISKGLAATADPVRLGQVLTNLLANAYRYGGPSIDIESNQTDGLVHIAVTDDGEGVPDELLSTLFDPFTRGSNVRAIAGSGIGLALSRRLAEAFGGSIDYEPLEPHGARFVLTLRAS